MNIGKDWDVTPSPDAFALISGMENIAYGKASQQSSTYLLYYSNNSVNGKHDDFSLTLWTSPFWWMVNLEKVCSIGEIKLYNRKDCCSEYQVQSFWLMVHIMHFEWLKRVEYFQMQHGKCTTTFYLCTDVIQYIQS